MLQKSLIQFIVRTFVSTLLTLPAVCGATPGGPSSQVHSATIQVSSATMHPHLFFNIGAAMNGPVARVYGATIGEWSARWWQWVLQIPDTQNAPNPLVDTTGASCGLGQKGPVWFLAGTFYPIAPPVERSCGIPKGKSIFFPIANYAWVQTYLDDKINTETDYRQCVSGFPPRDDMGCGEGIKPVAGGLEATLDNVPIIFNFATPIVRTQSPVFKVKHWAEPNVFYGVPALAGNDSNGYNNGDIVSDGFWVMLPPLKRGNHILKFRANDGIKDSQNVTYKWIIGK